jgi:hypothetical protein
VTDVAGAPVVYLLAGLGVHEVAGRASKLLTYATTRAVRPVRLYVPEGEAKDFLVYEVATRTRDGGEVSAFATREVVPASLFSSAEELPREILEEHGWLEVGTTQQRQPPWHLGLPSLRAGDQLIVGLTNRSTFARIVSGAFLCLPVDDDVVLGGLG